VAWVDYTHGRLSPYDFAMAMTDQEIVHVPAARDIFSRRRRDTPRPVGLASAAVRSHLRGCLAREFSHLDQALSLIADLENRSGFVSTKLAWASGLMLLVRTS
jgi:hypothetical protein